jgi:GAF domain-containing protein
MALVESLVRFARRVGATVCAEGVEEHDDIEVLANLDVPWGQGYALGRPAPPWSRISPPAAETCRTALAQALISSPSGESPITAGDRRLEHLTGRIANTKNASDLFSTLELMAGELHAEKITLSRWHGDKQLLETLAESGEQAQDEFFPIDDYPATALVIDQQAATQVLVGDPAADRSEVQFLLSQGYRSLLMVPIVLGGETLGIVEAMSEEERPWTRAEINRARIISHQLAAVIQSRLAPADRQRLES